MVCGTYTLWFAELVAASEDLAAASAFLLAGKGLVIVKGGACLLAASLAAYSATLDPEDLNRMPETTLRCLGVDHRKGNGARDRSLSETSKLVGQTIGRALSGGTKPFVPNAEEGDKVPPGGPVRARTLFPAEILHRESPSRGL